MDEAQSNDARGAGGQREACARTDQGAGEAPSCPESDCLGASLAAISGAGEGDIAGGACSRIARYLHALVYVDKIRVPERGNARILKPRPTLRLFGMRDTHACKPELPTLPRLGGQLRCRRELLALLWQTRRDLVPLTPDRGTLRGPSEISLSLQPVAAT